MFPQIMPSKNKVTDEIFLSNYNVQFFHQPLCFWKATSCIFLLQKNSQMNGGQNNKYDITKT